MAFYPVAIRVRLEIAGIFDRRLRPPSEAHPSPFAFYFLTFNFSFWGPSIKIFFHGATDRWTGSLE
jgi:hypothetical protein